MTSHRLLYKTILTKEGKFIHIPYDRIDPKYKVIVVDEVSMIPREIWDLLLSHKRYVLACGDPFQLPPVQGQTDVLDHPHIFLDEIMRQAKESEIIRLSMDIRNYKPISIFKGNEINIVSTDKVVSGMYTWADQIICGKNVTRRFINSYYREQLWGEDKLLPQEGDKIVCLRNEWETINQIGDPIVNGSIGYISKVKKINKNNIYPHKQCIIDFQPENCDESFIYPDLGIDYQLITTGEPLINKDNFKKFPKWQRPKEFDYAYAITCWRAQGSEYDKVLFFAEQVGRMSEEQYARYLYTGCTRAASRLTMVIDNV